MKEKQRVIVVDEHEHKIAVKALNDMRTVQIRSNRPTDDVDKLLLKVIDAPTKGKKVSGHAR